MKYEIRRLHMAKYRTPIVFFAGIPAVPSPESQNLKLQFEHARTATQVVTKSEASPPIPRCRLSALLRQVLSTELFIDGRHLSHQGRRSRHCQHVNTNLPSRHVLPSQNLKPSSLHPRAHPLSPSHRFAYVILAQDWS